MSKFFKNLFKLLSLKTPLFIILKFIVNFLPNYKTRNKSKTIEKKIYNNFSSYNENEKWFCNNLYFLSKKLSSVKHINDILEIGSYEGRSAIFYLHMFPESNITCVDTWAGSDEHDKEIFSKIENNFDYNTSQFTDKKKLLKFKMTSNEYFANCRSSYDLIYVDGDHSYEQVKIDIDKSWNLLKKNGLLILDDYLWWFYKDLKKNPAYAINQFIIKNIDDISDLTVWKQIIIKKK